jgi:hypothetical protein
MLRQRRILEAFLKAPAHVELGGEVGVMRDAQSEYLAHVSFAGRVVTTSVAE